MPSSCDRRAWLLAAAAALMLIWPDAEAAPKPTRIYVLPAGDVPSSELDAITGALTAYFTIEIKRLPKIALPRRAYYRPRKRYRADKLLDYVENLPLPEDGRTILVVTAAPISITKGRTYDWGIIGYVAIGGQICAYSTYYVKRGVSGAQALERIGKIAVHEFTHNLGLRHCPTRGCLMEDAQGTPWTFDRVYDFCPVCRAKIARAGWAIRPTLVIPWPRPAKNAGPSDAYLRKIRRLW
jgi:archaemetzincin